MERIGTYTLVEIPDDMGPFPEQKSGDLLYSKEYQSVRFHCPCGCGEQIYLRVCPMSERDTEKTNNPEAPIWGFEPSTITISPSIQNLFGCRSHFHVQNGGVKW